MKKIFSTVSLLVVTTVVSAQVQDVSDTTFINRTYSIDEVVVTGARHQTDVRHLSQTVSVVNRPRNFC